MDKDIGPEAYDLAVKTFLENIFHSDQTLPVNEETIKNYRNHYIEYHQKHNNLVKTWTELEEVELMLPVDYQQNSKVEVAKDESDPLWRYTTTFCST